MEKILEQTRLNKEEFVDSQKIMSLLLGSITRKKENDSTPHSAATPQSGFPSHKADNPSDHPQNQQKSTQPHNAKEE